MSARRPRGAGTSAGPSLSDESFETQGQRAVATTTAISNGSEDGQAQTHHEYRRHHD